MATPSNVTLTYGKRKGDGLDREENKRARLDGEAGTLSGRQVQCMGPWGTLPNEIFSLILVLLPKIELIAFGSTSQGNHINTKALLPIIWKRSFVNFNFYIKQAFTRPNIPCDFDAEQAKKDINLNPIPEGSSLSQIFNILKTIEFQNLVLIEKHIHEMSEQKFAPVNSLIDWSDLYVYVNKLNQNPNEFSDLLFAASQKLDRMDLKNLLTWFINHIDSCYKNDRKALTISNEFSNFFIKLLRKSSVVLTRLLSDIGELILKSRCLHHSPIKSTEAHHYRNNVLYSLPKMIASDDSSMLDYLPYCISKLANNPKDHQTICTILNDFAVSPLACDLLYATLLANIVKIYRSEIILNDELGNDLDVDDDLIGEIMREAVMAKLLAYRDSFSNIISSSVKQNLKLFLIDKVLTSYLYIKLEEDDKRLVPKVIEYMFDLIDDIDDSDSRNYILNKSADYCTSYREICLKVVSKISETLTTQVQAYWHKFDEHNREEDEQNEDE